MPFQVSQMDTTPSRGRIEIDASRKAMRFILEVRDLGWVIIPVTSQVMDARGRLRVERMASISREQAADRGFLRGGG